MWRAQDPICVKGVQVVGDKEVSPTTRWNLIYLALIGWKTIQIFEVERTEAVYGYRIGFVDFKGKTMIDTTVYHDTRFGMKIGHENCTFFVLDSINGDEIPLKLVERTHKSNPLFKKQRIPIR